MLTLEELRYMNDKQGTTPRPNKKYCQEAIKDLDIALNLFDEKFKGKVYRVCFSNNEIVKLRIKRYSLAHLLGFFTHRDQCEQFMREFYGCCEGNTTYQSLVDIMNNKRDFLEFNYLTEGRLFNFYRIKSRLEAFIKMAEFEKYGFCGMFADESIAKKSNPTLLMQSEIFLIMESGEPLYPYYALGLAKDVKAMGSNGYYAETLFPNRFDTFLTEQEVAIPLSMKVELDNEVLETNISNYEKLRAVCSSLKLRQAYGMKIDCDKYRELCKSK